MTYQYQDIFNLFPTAKTFLDLGCGQGFISLYAAARDLQVDAIDKGIETPFPLQEVPRVSYIPADIRMWKPTKKYDIIVANHILQFLPKEYTLNKFLPLLQEHLNQNGILDIFTFTPEETLDVPTKYTLEEVVTGLNTLKILKQEVYSYKGMHRKVGKHTFHEMHVTGKKL